MFLYVITYLVRLKLTKPGLIFLKFFFSFLYKTNIINILYYFVLNAGGVFSKVDVKNVFDDGIYTSGNEVYSSEEVSINILLHIIKHVLNT